MDAELVQTLTSDNIRLDGAFFDAERGARGRRPVDAFLIVHGSGLNFYQPLLLALARHLRGVGYACASFNNRGHDIAWLNYADGRFYGNAFEVMNHCRLDIRAGIDWLSERGFRRIGLLGHSLGGVKVIYYQALERDPRVAALVSLSPVRLSSSYFLASEDAGEFREALRRARRLVAQGRPDALIQVNFPMPHIFSASSYIDKHGPDERYNLLKYAHLVTCPLLVVGGTLETHTRLRDFPAELVKAAVNSPRADLIILEETDHAYTGKYQEAAEAITGWLSRLAESHPVKPPASLGLRGQG